MRIAFYAPLKAPSHAVPSGDRRVGRLLVDALRVGGHQVDLVSELRTYDRGGDASRQVRLRDESRLVADGLIRKWEGSGRAAAPDLWFTYHVYYKAPDWVGPMVSRVLGIPYAIAEASYAPKRENGAWALGHSGAREAIHAASLILCPIRDDMACIETEARPGARVELLPPFLDPAPYRAALMDRNARRDALRGAHGLDDSVPWIVVAAMMRPGDKAASYRMLAENLKRIEDLPWKLVVAGDGLARDEIVGAIDTAVPGRACYLGECDSELLASVYAAGDLCVWPAVNEAYGMAMLEAQAAGLPVISRRIRGVQDVVLDGVTGLLAPPDEEGKIASFTRELLCDPTRRRSMGEAAARFVAAERSVEVAATRLNRALEGLSGNVTQSPGLQRR